MIQLVASLAVVALALLFCGDAKAACDCATSYESPWCTGSDITITSEITWDHDANGSTAEVAPVQTIDFGSRGGNDTYVCGQYATGDFWVVGKGSPLAVVVDSVTPALERMNTIEQKVCDTSNSTWRDDQCNSDADCNGGVYSCNTNRAPNYCSPANAPTGCMRNGHQSSTFGPGYKTNKLDQQLSYQAVARCLGGDCENVYPGDALPATYDVTVNPVSFKKGTSRDMPTSHVKGQRFFMCSTSADGAAGAMNCVLFMSVTTFVDAIPDSNGNFRTDDEFRPSHIGLAKAGPFTTVAMQTPLASWPALDSSITFPDYNNDGNADGDVVAWANDTEGIRLYYRYPRTLWGDNPHSANDEPFLSNQELPMGRGNSGYNSDKVKGDAAALMALAMDNSGIVPDIATCLANNNNECAFHRADQRSAGSQALINIVQRGIDTLAAIEDGKRTWEGWHNDTGWGGHYHGQKLLPTVAAGLLNDPAFLANVNAGGGCLDASCDDAVHVWSEDRQIFTNLGYPWFGYGEGDCKRKNKVNLVPTCAITRCVGGDNNGTICDEESDCTAGGGTCAGSDATERGHCRSTHAGAAWDISCCGHRAYPERWLQHIKWASTILEQLSMDSLWNHPSYFEIGRSFSKGNRGGNTGHSRKQLCVSDFTSRTNLCGKSEPCSSANAHMDAWVDAFVDNVPGAGVFTASVSPLSANGTSPVPVNVTVSWAGGAAAVETCLDCTGLRSGTECSGSWNEHDTGLATSGTNSFGAVCSVSSSGNVLVRAKDGTTAREMLIPVTVDATANLTISSVQLIREDTGLVIVDGVEDGDVLPEELLGACWGIHPVVESTSDCDSIRHTVTPPTGGPVTYDEQGHVYMVPGEAGNFGCVDTPPESCDDFLIACPGASGIDMDQNGTWIYSAQCCAETQASTCASSGTFGATITRTWERATDVECAAP